MLSSTFINTMSIDNLTHLLDSMLLDDHEQLDLVNLFGKLTCSEQIGVAENINCIVNDLSRAVAGISISDEIAPNTIAPNTILSDASKDANINASDEYINFINRISKIFLMRRGGRCVDSYNVQSLTIGRCH
jgi:hypothetical protein